MAVALVTGCSSGIGLATAVGLARDGHQVFASMRDPARAGPLREAAAAAGVELSIVALDVTDEDEEALHDLAASIVADAGRIDVLVNNAGVGSYSVIEDTTPDRFREVWEANFLGAVRCIQAVLPAMRDQRSGCIVNMSSVSGRVAIPTLGAYAASKWALEALSEVLAQEVRALGIRLHVVEPGNVATPMMANATRTTLARLKNEPPEESAEYGHVYARIGRFGAYARGRLAPAELVADAVSRIVADPNAPFRVPVGADAEHLLPARHAMTDEEWLSIFAQPEDEAAARLAALFGYDRQATP